MCSILCEIIPDAPAPVKAFFRARGVQRAGLVLSILPVIVVYLCLQKHIIGGVVAGAVKA